MLHIARQGMTDVGRNSTPQARRFFLYLALLVVNLLFFIVPSFGAESSSLQQPGAGYMPALTGKLAFSVQPSTAVAVATISPAVQVAVQNAAGTLVTSANNSVTIAISNNPVGGTLSGTTTVNAVNGVATFSNLRINLGGVGYTLVASSTPGQGNPLTSATSQPFNITVGPAANLAFTVQPSATLAGATIFPSVRVEVRDDSGNRVTSSTAAISISISANPVGGSLSGTTTVNAVNGVANFADLRIDSRGVGYTLGASTGSGLTGATSSAFIVTDGIGFDGGGRSLATMGASATVTVKTVGVPPGADGVQINIQHSAEVTITSPVCVGIFSGANVLGPTAVSGGTLMGCFVPAGNVSGTSGTGGVMTFRVTRAGTGNPVLTFGLGGASGTRFSSAGVVISPGITNTLQISGAATIAGTVTLQGRTSSSPGVGHGIAKVTSSSGGVTASVSADGGFTLAGALSGTTLTASAPGYVSRMQTNLAVPKSEFSVAAVQLRCGLVNDDNMVDIVDVTATADSFGKAVSARVDAQGRFVDQNGNGVVEVDDVTCVASNFGVTSPQTWP